MRSINRSLAVITPKAPYAEWANGLLTEGEHALTLEELPSLSFSLLIPGYDDEEEGHEYVERNYQTIFELHLDAWEMDRETWPRDITLERFDEWFDVMLRPMVIDMLDEPVRRNENEL